MHCFYRNIRSSKKAIRMLEISEVGMISKEQHCVGDERGLKCVYIPLGMIDKIRLVSSIDCNAILKKK